jgi:hypothetical protein
MQGQKTTLWWIDVSATCVPGIPAISLALWNADVTSGKVTNFTPAIQAGYTLNPTDSDTDDTAMVSDVGNAQRRGLYNYEARFQFAMEADVVTNTTSIYLAAYNKFKTRGVQGYWARRIGYPQSLALAVGHALRCFYVQSFSPKILDSDKGKPIWLEINYGQQGYMSPVPTAVVA